MLLEEDFFESECRIFTALREAGLVPPLIVDIGASNGGWTEQCLKIFPDTSYRMYEPLYGHLPHYRAGIDSLVARNKNVEIRPVALTDRTGTTDFYIMPNAVGSTLHALPIAQKIEVEGTTLSRDLVGGLPEGSIVKIDTQGGELLILQGARDVIRTASVVLVECWLYPGYGKETPLLHQIIAELKTHDFHAFAMSAPYFNQDNIIYAFDVYFGSKNTLELFGAHPLSRKRDRHEG